MNHTRIDSNPNRRDFIKIGTVCLAGTVMSVKPAEAQIAGLLASVARFAGEVLSSYVASHIDDYMGSLTNSLFRQHIAETNNQLGRLGYSDSSQSTVRQNDVRIYYPMVVENCGCKDCAVPFFNVQCGCTPITRIDGCHMTGLFFASRDLRQEYPASVAASWLVPTAGISLAEGNRTNGYRTPVQYKTDRGSVAIDYAPRDDRSGTAEVTLYSKREKVKQTEYDFRYA